jgi:hypothetical protein
MTDFNRIADLKEGAQWYVPQSRDFGQNVGFTRNSGGASMFFHLKKNFSHGVLRTMETLLKYWFHEEEMLGQLTGRLNLFIGSADLKEKTVR